DVDIVFEECTIVYYSGIRQFGWWRLMPTADVEASFEAFGFGPEGVGTPLDPKSLIATMARRGIPIKTLLLDQSFIAGLGNIYVDEVLFRARVHPATPTNRSEERRVGKEWRTRCSQEPRKKTEQMIS